MWLTDWIKALFHKVADFVSKMWSLAKPFLQEALSQTALNVWVSCKDLFVEAAQYVEAQGLPTSSDKRDAFSSYMKDKAGKEIEDLKDAEFNLLREMAVAIMQKLQE